MQNADCRMQNAKCRMQNVMRDLRPATCDLRPAPAIQNPKSKIQKRNIIMNRRIIAGLILALALSLGLLGVASAHAKLVSSDPAAGAKLTKAPTKVTLIFSEEISAKPDESNFTVTDEQGNEVGKGQLDTNDLDHKTQSG